MDGYKILEGAIALKTKLAERVLEALPEKRRAEARAAVGRVARIMADALEPYAKAAPAEGAAGTEKVTVE